MDNKHMSQRNKEATMLEEKIRTAFDEVSQRQTRPRRLIADRLVELAVSGENFTIDELWQEMRELDLHLGRATVYRSVEKLVTLGLLDRVDFADGTHLYRVCGENHHHHHLTCTQCHLVVEIDVCLPVDQLHAIGRETSFDIEGHSLTLFGRCKSCRVQ
jgi:Fur family transcriptional regulator, ferric uptake regulator